MLIEKLAIASAFVLGLTLGYFVSGSILGPGVLAVLAGGLVGSLFSAFLHRLIQRDRG